MIIPLYSHGIEDQSLTALLHCLGQMTTAVATKFLAINQMPSVNGNPEDLGCLTTWKEGLGGVGATSSKDSKDVVPDGRSNASTLRATESQ